jgi:Fe-S-cluster containining protein
MQVEHILRSAKHKTRENEKFLAGLKKKNPANLDKLVHDIHAKVFLKTDCLLCANCCKTISPMITNKDIERISKRLKMKSSVFMENFLYLDADHHYVFNQSPCPFLMPDNYCSVYEQRPKACAGYPHTNRKKIYQLLDLTIKNTLVCPAVYEIVEILKTIKR